MPKTLALWCVGRGCRRASVHASSERRQGVCASFHFASTCTCTHVCEACAPTDTPMHAYLRLCKAYHARTHLHLEPQVASLIRYGLQRSQLNVELLVALFVSQNRMVRKLGNALRKHPDHNHASSQRTATKTNHTGPWQLNKRCA